MKKIIILTALLFCLGTIKAQKIAESYKQRRILVITEHYKIKRDEVRDRLGGEFIKSLRITAFQTKMGEDRAELLSTKDYLLIKKLIKLYQEQTGKNLDTAKKVYIIKSGVFASDLIIWNHTDTIYTHVNTVLTAGKSLDEPDFSSIKLLNLKDELNLRQAFFNKVMQLTSSTDEEKLQPVIDQAVKEDESKNPKSEKMALEVLILRKKKNTFDVKSFFYNEVF